MAKRPGVLPKIFSGTHVKPIDQKGRVSVPPDFRARFDDLRLGLYVMRSVSGEMALDVFEPRQYERFVSNSEQVFSREAMDTAFAIFGSALNLGFDPEGRIKLPEHFREHAGIAGSVCFVGLGRFIQIWEPAAGRAKGEEAYRRAVEKRDSIMLPLARPRGEAA